MLRRYKMLLGRKRDVCARVLCASIHGLLYQLKMSKDIRQRFKLLYVPYDLKAILSKKIPDVAVSANGGSEYFNALYSEHLWRKLLGHVLNGRVEVPIDSGIALSIRIDNLGVFINKTLSTESLINQLLIVGKLGEGMRSCKYTGHDVYACGCQ